MDGPAEGQEFEVPVKVPRVKVLLSEHPGRAFIYSQSQISRPVPSEPKYWDWTFTAEIAADLDLADWAAERYGYTKGP